MRATRPFVLLLAAATFLALVSSPAGAVPPFQERFTNPVDIRLPAGRFCEFPVLLEIEQKTKFILFFDGDGDAVRGLGVGRITMQITNIESGESKTFRIPGPTFVDFRNGTVRGTGPWVIFQPGELFYAAGQITFTEDGVVVTRGRRVDLCRLLG